MASFYATIEEKGFDTGIAFIMAQNASVIEAHLYSGVVIFFKSLRMTFEQISDILARGDIREVTFRKAEIRPETAQARVVGLTFPAAIAASAMSPSRTSLSRLLRIVRLMSSLTKVDRVEGMNAFDIMSRQLSLLYPRFLLDSSTLKKRISKISDEFGIETRFLDQKPMPPDIYSFPDWVVSNFSAVPDSLMREVVLYYVFFGEVFKKFIRTIVEKEASLGAKQGYAALSQEAYPGLQDSGSAAVYRGAEKVGDIKLNWSTSKKNAALFTKADLDKLGLNNGDTIELILEG